MGSGRGRRGLWAGAAIAAGYGVGTVLGNRLGYSFGRKTLVRCNRGHSFSTVWIPGASVKAVRLGPWRVQWCPVGRHLAVVHPVKAASMSEEERAAATARHDIRLP